MAKDVNDVGNREHFTGWMIRETYANNGEIPDRACQQWTSPETAPVGIVPLTDEMCSEFQKALGQGAAGVITEEEKQALRTAGVPDGVIYAVGDADNMRALQERARWFVEKAITPGSDDVKQFWMDNAYTSPLEVIKMFDVPGHNSEAELAKRGKEAQVAVPIMIDVLKKTSPEIRANVVKALAEIGPNASPVVPVLIEVLHSKDVPEPVHNSAVDALFKIHKELPLPGEIVKGVVKAVDTAAKTKEVDWIIKEPKDKE